MLRCISVHHNLFIPADQNRYCANSVDPDEKIKSIFLLLFKCKKYKVKISFLPSFTTLSGLILADDKLRTYFGFFIETRFGTPCKFSGHNLHEMPKPIFW